MSTQALKGKKIAVLVESQYIAEELAQYRERFEEDGAEVHFLANLYGQPHLNLVSEVEEPGRLQDRRRCDQRRAERES